MIKLLFSLMLVLVPFGALAQFETDSAKGLLDRVAGKAGYVTVTGEALDNNAIGYIANIINIALSFIGVIFVVLIIYAGFLWMTARGNDSQVEKAQGYIKNSIIGIIVIFTAFIVSTEVLILVSQSVGVN